MQSLATFLLDGSVAGGMATLSLAVALGLAFGAIRFRGVRLGISGVLFSALLFGQIGLSVDPGVLGFLRDFALIIFVYAIGLQVGPGFISSLRAEGLRLNVLAVTVLALGAVMTLGVVKLARLTSGSSPGLYAGAFTTTPGLAAGQEALGNKLAGAPAAANAAVATAALAYTVSYPLGMIGPILVIVALRKVFGIRLDEERKRMAAAQELRRPPVASMDFEVTEPSHTGTALRHHPLVHGRGIVFSRMRRGDALSVPTADTRIQVGDIYRAVGARSGLKELVTAMGRPATADLTGDGGEVTRMELVVTRTRVLRRSLRELDLIRRTGVTIARINRAGLDLVPRAALRLAFADRLTVVGPEAGVKTVEAELGNCPETLDRPQLIPIFLGIVLGVIVGSIPLRVPGLGVTLRIGLAGGPLLAAIALSQLGNVGSVIWYMPVSANQLFRDFGLAVFLACVGLQAGDHLLHKLLTGSGLYYVLWGAAITLLPVFAVGCFARLALRMNFVTLSGWVAGAMTSSPALLFANDLAGSDAPAVAYAAVAPLATLIPILCAQLLAI
ncbi:MAG TPA: putative transporter [Tepidisphaeraceae bacterium]|nr:putative transporter [Tepidisphaeraceae bacterium]